MPPTIHSSSSAKPDVMSLTWKPRLVNTPTPIMSATTMAVAVTAEIVGRTGLVAVVMLRSSPPPTSGFARLYKLAVADFQPVLRLFPAQKKVGAVTAVSPERDAACEEPQPQQRRRGDHRLALAACRRLRHLMEAGVAVGDVLILASLAGIRIAGQNA